MKTEKDFENMGLYVAYLIGYLDALKASNKELAQSCAKYLDERAQSLPKTLEE